MSEAAAHVMPGQELYVRHARIDGRSVAVLRAIDQGHQCVVEAETWPNGPGAPSAIPGPYTFPTPIEATRFVTHAVEAFIALGCEVGAS
ncbi:MAG: hypothetical protein ACRDOF_04935 [Gaiellaceae bacterium]